VWWVTRLGTSSAVYIHHLRLLLPSLSPFPSLPSWGCVVSLAPCSRCPASYMRWLGTACSSPSWGVSASARRPCSPPWWPASCLVGGAPRWREEGGAARRGARGGRWLCVSLCVSVLKSLLSIRSFFVVEVFICVCFYISLKMCSVRKVTRGLLMQSFFTSNLYDNVVII